MPSPVRMLIACLAVIGILTTALAQAAAAEPGSLDDTFRLEASRTTGGDIELKWQVKPGSYLYRDSIAARQDDGAAISLDLPEGQQKDDPIFGLTQVIEGLAVVSMAANQTPPGGVITVSFQGCDGQRGVCFPPASRRIDLAKLNTGDAATRVSDAAPATDQVVAPQRAASPGVPSRDPPYSGESQDVAATVMGLGLAPLAAAFIGFGLLLSLTPCVLPMVPIVSGMLAKSGAATTRRGFVLSLTYVLAMASAYGALGVVAGWSGQNLQMALQTPWAIGAMSLVFVALALSMFGLYELKAPAWITNRLSRSGGNARGSLAGAALLGFTSALIVGPCVTPPLAGALLYVSQTGDMTRGAVALFALGLGMGLPLLALGLLGPRALPRSGPWLIKVNCAFGVMFLATAIYLASRVLPGPVTLGLWALLAIGVSVFLGAFDVNGARTAPARLSRAGGIAAAVYGAILLVGATSGASDPLQPLARLAAPAATTTPSANTVTVRTVAEFGQAMAAAQEARRSVVVDFTADWCSICKQIERDVFQTPEVQQRLALHQVIRIDITHNDADSRALMQTFAVVGPPAIILMKSPASPTAGQPKIVGAVDKPGFLARLDQAAM